MAAEGSRHARILASLPDRSITARPGKEEADARIFQTVDNVLKDIPENEVPTRNMIADKYQELFGTFNNKDERSRMFQAFHINYKDALFNSKNGNASRAEKGRKPRPAKEKKRGDPEVKTDASRMDAQQSSEDTEWSASPVYVDTWWMSTHVTSSTCTTRFVHSVTIV